MTTTSTTTTITSHCDKLLHKLRRPFQGTNQAGTSDIQNKATSCLLRLLNLLVAILLLASGNKGQYVEVSEEHQQTKNVVQVGISDVSREGTAVSVQQVSSLGVHQHKLHHLALGEVRLPPDVLGMHGQKVVSVHDGVNQSVQDDR